MSTVYILLFIAQYRGYSTSLGLGKCASVRGARLLIVFFLNLMEMVKNKGTIKKETIRILCYLAPRESFCFLRADER